MAAPTATTGVALTVRSRDAAHAVREQVEARDDLAVHAVRIIDPLSRRVGEPFPISWERTRTRCRRYGLGPDALAELDAIATRVDTERAVAFRHAVELSMADTGFVLVVVDPSGGEAVTPELSVLGAVFDRTLLAAESLDDANVQMTRPDPARLERRLDRDLVTAALGGGQRALPAWQAWRGRETIDDYPGFGEIAPLLAEQFERLGADDPDLERIQGIRRRAWYSHQVLRRDAAEAVEHLRRAGCEPVVAGDLAIAIRAAETGAVRNGHRVDLHVPPDDAVAAVRSLTDLGWVTGSGPVLTAGRVRRRASTLLRREPRRALALHWRPLPERCSHLVDPPRPDSCRPVDLHGTTARSPASTDLLLAHWARTSDPTPGHLVRTLYSTADLVALGDVDWDRLWADCDRLELRRYGAMYLRLLEVHAGRSTDLRSHEPGPQPEAAPPCA